MKTAKQMCEDITAHKLNAINRMIEDNNGEYKFSQYKVLSYYNSSCDIFKSKDYIIVKRNKDELIKLGYQLKFNKETITHNVWEKRYFVFKFLTYNEKTLKTTECDTITVSACCGE